MVTREEEQEYYFEKGRTGRGYSRIHNSIEDATSHPGLNYTQRRKKLADALRIIRLIENTHSRNTYRDKIRETKKTLKEMFSTKPI